MLFTPSQENLIQRGPKKGLLGPDGKFIYDGSEPLIKHTDAGIDVSSPMPEDRLAKISREFNIPKKQLIAMMKSDPQTPVKLGMKKSGVILELEGVPEDLRGERTDYVKEIYQEVESLLKKTADKEQANNTKLFFNHFLKSRILNPLSFEHDRELRTRENIFNLKDFEVGDQEQFEKITDLAVECYFSPDSTEKEKAAMLKFFFNSQVFVSNIEWSKYISVCLQFLKEDYQRSYLLTEHMLGFYVDALSADQAAEALEPISNNKRLSGDLAQAIFFKFPELRDNYKNNVFSTEHLKIEGFSDPRRLKELEESSLNEADPFGPHEGKTGKIGLEIELKLAGQNIWNQNNIYANASNAFFHQKINELNGDFVSAGPDGDMMEIRGRGGIRLNKDNIARMISIKNLLEKSPYLVEFATNHGHTDIPENLKYATNFYERSVMFFRRGPDHNRDSWETNELPPAVTDDRSRGIRIPYLFEMTQYIDQQLVLDYFKEIEAMSLGYAELEECGIFTERDKMNFSALAAKPIDNYWRQVATEKILIYLALKHGKNEIIPAILRLKSKNRLPSLNWAVAMKAESLAENDPQMKTQIINLDINGFINTLLDREMTYEKTEYLKNLFKQRTVKTEFFLKHLKQISEIDADNDCVIYNLEGLIDKFDIELALSDIEPLIFKFLKNERLTNISYRLILHLKKLDIIDAEILIDKLLEYGESGAEHASACINKNSNTLSRHENFWAYAKNLASRNKYSWQTSKELVKTFPNNTVGLEEIEPHIRNLESSGENGFIPAIEAINKIKPLSPVKIEKLVGEYIDKGKHGWRIASAYAARINPRYSFKKVVPLLGKILTMGEKDKKTSGLICEALVKALSPLEFSQTEDFIRDLIAKGDENAAVIVLRYVEKDFDNIKSFLGDYIAHEEIADIIIQNIIYGLPIADCAPLILDLLAQGQRNLALTLTRKIKEDIPFEAAEPLLYELVKLDNSMNVINSIIGCINDDHVSLSRALEFIRTCSQNKNLETQLQERILDNFVSHDEFNIENSVIYIKEFTREGPQAMIAHKLVKKLGHTPFTAMKPLLYELINQDDSVSLDIAVNLGYAITNYEKNDLIELIKATPSASIDHLQDLWIHLFCNLADSQDDKENILLLDELVGLGENGHKIAIHLLDASYFYYDFDLIESLLRKLVRIGGNDISIAEALIQNMVQGVDLKKGGDLVLESMLMGEGGRRIARLIVEKISYGFNIEDAKPFIISLATRDKFASDTAIEIINKLSYLKFAEIEQFIGQLQMLGEEGWRIAAALLEKINKLERSKIDSPYKKYHPNRR
jgi:hypothetical protein